MPIPKCVEEAKRLRVEALNLGKDEGEEVEYDGMKVGKQVQL